MKGLAWLAGLTALVLTALWPVSPVVQTRRMMQAHLTPRAPESDLPRQRGHRAVWATGAPPESLLRADDRRVEVVSRGGPFVDYDITRTNRTLLETEPRRLPLVVVLTVTDLEVGASERAAARSGDAPRFETRRVFARIDTVIKNRSVRPLLAGASIVFSYEGGGEIEVDGTRVATRFELERLPQRGRQYLWFLAATRDAFHGGQATNAFDVTGRRVLPQFRDRDFARLSRLSSAEALAVVRSLATLPTVSEYDSISNPRRTDLVYLPFLHRVALR